MREHAPGVTDEQPEEIVFRARELDLMPVARDHARREIDRQPAVCEDGRLFRGPRLALRGAEAREEFGGAERLRHVVVRARIERRHFVVLAIAHAEDEHRRLAPFAQPLQNDEPVQIGEAEIEEDHVWPAHRGFV